MSASKPARSRISASASCNDVSSTTSVWPHEVHSMWWCVAPGSIHSYMVVPDAPRSSEVSCRFVAVSSVR